MKLADLLEVAREARRSLDAADAAFAALPTERRREFLLRAVSSLGANDVIVAAAIIAQALDRHAEAVHNLAATIKIIGEKPKASTS